MLMTLETRLLSVQITKVDRNTYAKAFIAGAPDGVSEALSSVTQMNILEEKADEIFNYVNSRGVQFGDTVRLKVRAVRGSQNTVKNVIEEIEAIGASKQQQANQTQTATAKA